MWCKSNPASYNYLHIYLGLLHGYFVPLMRVVSAFVLSMNHLIRGFPLIQPLVRLSRNSEPTTGPRCFGFLGAELSRNNYPLYLLKRLSVQKCICKV